MQLDQQQKLANAEPQLARQKAVTVDGADVREGQRRVGVEDRRSAGVREERGEDAVVFVRRQVER